MFCERTHCALILMVTLAQCYGILEITLQTVACKHHLPITPFLEVVKLLAESNLLVVKDDKRLSLTRAPEKITIWQVVACVSQERALVCANHLSEDNLTSTVIMIRHQGEALHNIINSRLKRCKLSQWSKQASETVYI